MDQIFQRRRTKVESRDLIGGGPVERAAFRPGLEQFDPCLAHRDAVASFPRRRIGSVDNSPVTPLADYFGDHLKLQSAGITGCQAPSSQVRMSLPPTCSSPSGNTSLSRTSRASTSLMLVTTTWQVNTSLR